MAKADALVMFVCNQLATQLKRRFPTNINSFRSPVASCEKKVHKRGEIFTESESAQPRSNLFRPKVVG